MSPAGTTTASEAAGHAWDAIVVGAGPAGSLVARGLARTGRRTLLVESKRFPRDKVCGGCLQTHGQALLIRHGLASALNQANPLPLRELQIVSISQRLLTPLNGLVAVRRSLFDQVLVRAAIEAGVEFLPETTARLPVSAVESSRKVTLKTVDGTQFSTAAQVVICADGLNHPSLADHSQFASQIQPRSRIGLQAFLQTEDDEYPTGTLTMAVGFAGYVGLTRVENHLLNVAAAVNPSELRQQQRPAAMIRAILNRCGLPVPASIDCASWLGTPPLTRTMERAGARRLFLVGDASGYVEPFTGEGMTWALAAASALVPLASEACRQWKDSYPDQWQQILRQTVTDRQRICRLLARLLHHPHAIDWTMSLFRALPPLRQLAVRQVCGKPIRSAARSMPAA